MAAKKKVGRPSVGAEERKRRKEFMLSPPVIAFLDSVSNESGMTESAIVENYIRTQMRKHGGDAARAAQTSRN